ncbi:MAG TPA: SPOR domain-containing protein, partial [Flavilitoribacter sp.]|nr:SPOR domain-containing protein [Flavilitoribacter sp.]
DKAVAEALRRKEAAKPVVVEVSQGISSGQGLFRFGVTKQEAVGWGIQIGAFFDYGNVLIQAEKLQKQFNQPIVVSINELSGKTVYKVVVGAFSQKADADKLGQTVKAGGYSGAFTRNLADLA